MDLQALMQLPPGGLTVALLVLIRISSLFVTAPILGNLQVPVRLRVGLAIFITVLILPIELAAPRPHLDGTYDLTLAVLREMAVGLILGFVATTVFQGIQMAGHMISVQMGFSMSQMFDPNTRSQSEEISVLLGLLASMTFLAIDGHHWLILAVWRSFQTVPLGTFTPHGPLISKVLAATTGIFDTALTLMLPIVGVLAIIDLTLAILNKVMPQMNVFSISSGIKILIGLWSLAAILPLFGETVEILLQRMLAGLVGFF